MTTTRVPYELLSDQEIDFGHHCRRRPPLLDYVYRPSGFVVPGLVRLQASMRMDVQIPGYRLGGLPADVSALDALAYRAVAGRCAKALQMNVPQLLSGAESEVIVSFGTSEAPVLLLSVDALSRFAPEQLAFVVGHGLGRIRFRDQLQQHSVARNGAHRRSNLVGSLTRVLCDPWARASVISADRAGLLCVEDLGVAESTLQKWSCGQVRRKGALARWGTGGGRSREALAVDSRLQALRVFAESELFRQHVGLVGGTALTSVNRRVGRLLGRPSGMGADG